MQLGTAHPMDLCPSFFGMSALGRSCGELLCLAWRRGACLRVEEAQEIPLEPVASLEPGSTRQGEELTLPAYDLPVCCTCCPGKRLLQTAQVQVLEGLFI